MLRRLRTGVTFANVISLIALFVALGGTSYAAVILKKNSVRSAHIRDGQVTTKDVKNASLTAQDFAPGQLTPGPQGERGPKGDTGAQGPGASKILHRSDTPGWGTEAVEIAKAGPWSVRALCFGGAESFKFYLYVRGPGAAQSWTETSLNDATSVLQRRSGANLASENNTLVAASEWTNDGAFTRLVAEIQLHSATETATVSVNGLTDNRTAGQEHCNLYGTAVPAG